jgi:hypothetical protein
VTSSVNDNSCVIRINLKDMRCAPSTEMQKSVKALKVTNFHVVENNSELIISDKEECYSNDTTNTSDEKIKTSS